MRELFIPIIGLVVLFVLRRGNVARRERAKAAALGLGLLAVAVYYGTIVYHLSLMDLLLLRYRLPLLSRLSRIDVPLVLGYGLLGGAALSMFFPAKSSDT